MVRCLFLIACLLLVNTLGKTVSKSPIDYAAFHYTEKTDVIPHPTETVFVIKTEFMFRLWIVA